MRGYQSKRRGFKLLAVGNEGWRGCWDVHREKSWGHLSFSLVPTAELGLASPLHPLCNQEGTFCMGSQGEATAPGRVASHSLVQLAQLAVGSVDGPCSAPWPMALCLAAWQRAPCAPKAPSDRLWVPTAQSSTCNDKIKARFRSKSLTVRDSAG